MNRFDFKTQLVMSAGVASSDDVRQMLLDNIPGATGVRKATTNEDRSGTDWWIDHERGSAISVDTKIRPHDPVERYGKDDLALEVWSIVPGSHRRDRALKAIGWTLDETKRTDYVLWLWKNTKRWTLIPFPQLCASFKKRLDIWYEIYQHNEQVTERNGIADYRSEMLLVPRRVVWAALYEDFGGLIAPSNENAPFVAIDDNARPSEASLFSTAFCDLCKQYKTITIPAEGVLTWHGVKTRMEKWKATVCSTCWIANGFKISAANDNTPSGDVP